MDAACHADRTDALVSFDDLVRDGILSIASICEIVDVGDGRLGWWIRSGCNGFLAEEAEAEEEQGGIELAFSNANLVYSLV